MNKKYKGYARQCCNTKQRLKGKTPHKSKKKIVAIGYPMRRDPKNFTLVPVELDDGTFRILRDEHTMQILLFKGKERWSIERAIRKSQKMPLVRVGKTPGVAQIIAYPPQKHVACALIKIYFDDKRERHDEIVLRYTKNSKQDISP